MIETLKEFIETSFTILFCFLVVWCVTAILNYFSSKPVKTCCLCKETKTVVVVNKEDNGVKTSYEICPQCIIKLIEKVN